MIKKLLIISLFGVSPDIIASLAVENTDQSIQSCKSAEWRKTYKNYDCIELLHETDIEQCKVIVMQDFAANALMRKGIIAVASLAAVYATYKIAFESSDRAGVIPGDVDPVSREEFNELNRRFKAFQYAIDPSWFSWQWFKNWGKSLGKGLLSMAATKHLFDIGERSLQDIFHDGTAAWFVKSRMRFMQLMPELQAYAQKIDAFSQLSWDEQAHYRQQLIFIGNSLVKDMALLCAFMEFQLTNTPFSESGLKEGHDLISYLKACTNNFSASMNNTLSERTVCMPSILKFSQEFEKIMMSFSRIEQEKNNSCS